MFFTSLLRFLLGYIRFRAEGGGIPLFLTLAARAHIPLWNLKSGEGALYANVRRSRYRRLLPVAAKAGVRIAVAEKHGLPVQLERHRRRWGFALGFLIFAAALCYLSGFVWRVEVEGNSAVQTREILYELDALGLRPGIRTAQVDLRRVEQRALVELPGLSWMHINLVGGTATVEVGERTARPEIIPENEPCNVVALQTGQIVRMQVYEGAAALRPGDTVLKGALLVGGLVQEPKSGAVRSVHARAVVIARTIHRLAVTAPYTGMENRDTGRVSKRYTLQLLGAALPLYRSEPAGNFRRTVYKTPVRLGKLELPVALRTTVFTEYRSVPVVYGFSRAQAKAGSLLAQKEKTELAGTAVLSRQVEVQKGKTGVTLVGTYTCEEDIACESAIVPAGH